MISEPYAIAAALPQAAGGQLLARLKDQLHQLVSAASAHAAPTHLGAGVRFGVSEAGSGVIGDVQAGVTARVDLGRVALSSPAEEPVFGEVRGGRRGPARRSRWLAGRWSR